MTSLNKHSDLSVFKKLAKTEFGLNFDSKNEHLLSQAINQRIKAQGLDSHEQGVNSHEQGVNSHHHYFHQLTDNAAELRELVCLLTNNETYFYREACQIKFLTDTLLPTIRAAKSGLEPIRILSLGCSTGAEPYSIAMALHQKFGSNTAQSYTIMGADVDIQALDKARAAHYSAMAFRSLTPELKQRYFTQQHSVPDAPPNAQYKQTLFSLKPEIRDMVSFHYLNIVSDMAAAKLQEIDVVFFRNVSIYFDQATRQLIQKNIISLLQTKAYLLVGLTESMSNDFGLLKLQNQGNIFYFLKDDALDTAAKTNKAPANRPIKHLRHPSRQEAPTATKEKSIPAVAPSPEARPTQSSKDSVVEQANQADEIKTQLSNKDYDRVLQLLEKYADDYIETAEHLLLRAFIFFNRQDFVTAQKFTQQALDLAPLSVDGFLLRGMIAKWQKQSEEAIQWFKKALYVFPDCWPAHYYLSGLYSDIGNVSKAAQEYQLVIQQLQDPAKDFCDRMTIPLSLPRAEIRLLCQSRLKQIDPSLATDASPITGTNTKGSRHGN